MTLLNARALGMTLGVPLFQNLNLTISKGDRVGLVAANGRGKSTLLACLAGSIDPTTGEISRARNLRIGHVLQAVPDNALDQTMYELALAALPPDQADYESWRVDVVLADLDVPAELQHLRLGRLSGGRQRTALLASTWVLEPELLLLDEPTNHLDLKHIALLEDWLAKLPRDTSVVITSHDRAFLDETTNRTLFLRPNASQIFDLPYTTARQALDDIDAADARRHANDLNKARQLRKQAAKLKNIGINSGSDLLVVKTKQLKDRADRIEATAKPAHREQSAGSIRLGNSGTHAKALITLDDVDVHAPDGRLLYSTGKKWVGQGDRIVLLGTNGAGKTRLVNLIADAISGRDSPVHCAPSVIAAYSDQHLSQVSQYKTPMSAVTEHPDVGDQRARTLLAGAGISVQLQDSSVEALSGGQKARLAMLLLRLKEPNFYLLDEPTNHLDIEGQEALEAELVAHGASCILVSHDRSFLRAVGTRFWCIERRRLIEVDDPEDFLTREMTLPQ